MAQEAYSDIDPDRLIFSKARELVQSIGMNFDHMYTLYMSEYYVSKGPNYMIWAKPIAEPVDAWFIFLAIGEGCLSIWHKQMPYYLPNIAFHRPLRGDNEMKIIPTKTMQRLLC